ncbi:MAG: hypothetical protein FJW31_13115 [Acidobacteria bacterium]|nr:hypothetical protein [Acidobacteriota bacterium]
MSAAAEKSDRVFGYVVTVCGGLEPDDFRGRSYRDLLDAFLEAESTGTCLEEMWPFGWGRIMRRWAPLQHAGVWDARQEALRLLGSPAFRLDHPSIYGGAIMYFPKPQLVSPAPTAPPGNKDQSRFGEVVRNAVELAQGRDLGEALLLIGGWGWGYDVELPADQQVTLMAAGFRHVDRRLP